MTYQFNKYIRTKTCGERSFLVNIHTNDMIGISTPTLHFLQNLLIKPLTPADLQLLPADAAAYIKSLEQENILEVVNHGC